MGSGPPPSVGNPHPEKGEIRKNIAQQRSSNDRHPQINEKTTVFTLRGYPMTEKKGSIVRDLAVSPIHPRSTTKKDKKDKKDREDQKRSERSRKKKSRVYCDIWVYI